MVTEAVEVAEEVGILDLEADDGIEEVVEAPGVAAEARFLEASLEAGVVVEAPALVIDREEEVEGIEVDLVGVTLGEPRMKDFEVATFVEELVRCELEEPLGEGEEE